MLSSRFWAGEQPGAPEIIRGWIIFQLESHQLQVPVLGWKQPPCALCPPCPFRQSLIFWGHQSQVPNAQYSVKFLICVERSSLC